MIALSFALPEESKGFVALLEDARSERPRWREGPPGLPVVRGKLDGREIAIVHTGMGLVSARRHLDAFFEKSQPRLLIASGFAGALASGFNVGEVIVAENCSDPPLLDKLREHLPPFRTGVLVTAGEVVETRAAKAEMAKRTGAGLVDMETEEISRQCVSRGIPMLAARAISDGALDDLPVPAAVWFDAARQRPRPAALVWHLLTHPGKIGPFAGFVAGIGQARAELTKFLAAAVAVLDPE